MGYRDERLWKILEEKAAQEDKELRTERQIAPEYLSAVKMVCDYGVQRAKTIRDTFPLYTLHDEVHICNVLNLMAELLGDEIEKLNRDEAAMLILSACCHDIGMSYSKEEKEELFEDRPRIERYLNANHSEYIKAYQHGGENPVLTDDMKQNYLRSIHHERVQELLNKKEWPWILDGMVDRDDLIRVCRSHGEGSASLSNLEKSHRIDLRFCAILLRLADILDFDTSRAPDALYEYSEMTGQRSSSGLFSKEEWDKHMSSHGFDFKSVKNRAYPYPLEYNAVCRDMQVEQKVNGYLNWVDQELEDCRRELRRFNGKWQDFILPDKIKRGIKAAGYVSGQYRLTLDQDQVLTLFTGENLYNDPAVFVRELIQNAIDAVRTRKQTDRNLPADWQGQINITSWRDEEGRHWFRIEDNGIGMTESIIRNYFLKIGCSYYNSDEFTQMKMSCGADPDYMPISRFGIGILSCFMGDRQNNLMEVSTKRFEQDNNCTPALRMSMHGINGYFYLTDQSKGHKGKEMPGRTQEEQKPYRREAGTVIAVRANLYQTGQYRSFREIVDKYVVCPEVPIHYEDEDGAYDYPTEKEFTDAVHNFYPSEDPEKDGVLEIPIPEEEFAKLYDVLPELEQVKRPLPKLLVRCFSLDKYTRSPYLKGALFLICLNHPISLVQTEIFGSQITAEVETHITVSENEEVKVHFSLEYPWGTYTEIEDALCRNALDMLYFTQKNNLSRLPSDMNENDRQNIITYVTKEHGKGLNISLPNQMRNWMKRYYLDKEHWITAHNGVLCVGNPQKYSWFTPLWETGLVLLKDCYRPIMTIARDNFGKLDLEALSDLSMVCGYIIKKYQMHLPIPYVPDRNIPLKTYWDLLDKRPEWIELMCVSNGKTVIPEKDLECITQNEEVILTDFQPLGWPVNPDENTSIEDLGSYYKLCAAYLRKNYTIKGRFIQGGARLSLMSGKEELPAHYEEYFSDFFFVKPMNENETVLTTGDAEERYTCNMDHRLARFMIENAELLHSRAKGIFYEMIRILRDDYNYHLIQNMNRQISILRELPDHPFVIPDGLELTEADLC